MNDKFADMNVAVLIPVRNEERYIKGCLDSVLAQSYPKKYMEVFVIDGLSNDATRKIIMDYSRSHPYIKLLDNPFKIVPKALNIGINASKGDIIIRLDAHAYYENDYIEKCVKVLKNSDAVNVGGPIVTLPGDNTRTAKAIALAISHPFGVGNSKFRTSVEQQYVDTVPFGAFKRSIFDKVGLFNEHLIRNQDVELNSRIRKSGKKIFLTPEVKSFYYSRPTLSALWSQNFKNGMWNIFTSALSKKSLSLRHFIPLIFILSIIVSIIAMALHPAGYALAGLVVLSYLFANVFFSMKLSAKNGISLLPGIMLSFGTLHFSYGFGSLWGLLRVSGWKKTLGAS